MSIPPWHVILGGQGIWLSSHIPPYGGKLTWRLMGSPNHGAPVFSGNKTNYLNLSSRYGEHIEGLRSSWSILLGQRECLPIAFWHGKYIMGKLSNSFQIVIIQKQTWVLPPLHSVESHCFAGLCSRIHREKVLNIIWPSGWTVPKDSTKLSLLSDGRSCVVKWRLWPVQLESFKVAFLPE